MKKRLSDRAPENPQKSRPKIKPAHLFFDDAGIESVIDLNELQRIVGRVVEADLLGHGGSLLEEFLHRAHILLQTVHDGLVPFGFQFTFHHVHQPVLVFMVFVLLLAVVQHQGL